ncbi:MAG TPA: transporter substrate-binding domain-containing protein, partial [Trinickia sp.]|nr:transporter substrate-binding domain-containing protein [Trinickia sp.]
MTRPARSALGALARCLASLASFACCAAIAGASPGALGAQSVLRVGAYENDSSVLDYVDNAGMRQGLNPSVLRAIADPRGVPLSYRGFASAPAGLAALERGEIDVMPVACDTDLASHAGWLSAPYAVQQAGVVLSRVRTDPRGLADLAGLRIALARGSLGGSATMAWLPAARFVETNDAQAALDAVSSGRADAFVGIQDANVSMLSALALGSLKSVPLPLSVSLCFAARSGDAAVTSLIESGLARLSPAMRSEMLMQPSPVGARRASDEPFALTPEEKAWVRRHPVVRVGVQRGGRPYDCLDDQGIWRGLGATLLKQFAQIAHVQFKPVLVDDARSLSDALRDGSVDLVSSYPSGAAAWSPGLALTRAYDSFPWAVVKPAHGDVRINRIASTPWRMQRVLPVQLFDDATIVARTSAADALRAVLAGNADAALINMVAAEELAGLYPRGRLTIDPTVAGIERTGFAVAEPNAVLAAMLDRYLASYDRRELARLASASRPVSVVLGYEKRSVIAMSLAAAAIVLAVLATLVCAYRRTRAAERAAVAARGEAVAAREEAEAADRAKSAFVAMMSHEIRTPMNGVVGVLDLFGTTAVTSQQRRFLDVADRSARSMLRVIDDALDYPIKSKVTWTPYAWIGYSYTWTSSGSPTLSGVAFPGASIGGAVQLTLGASGQVTKNLQVYGELAGQSRINGYGHSAVT